MIRDFNFGQYIKTDSVVHRADPRTKLLVVFAYIIFLVTVNTFQEYIWAAIGLVVFVSISRIKAKYVINSLRPIVLIIVFTSIFSIFGTGGVPIFKLGFLTVTMQGAILTLKLIVRLCLLIVSASALTYTTTPMELTGGIEQMFSLIKFLKTPIHIFAMIMTIALRFIPTLMMEADKIIKAQLSRGADLDSGNFIKRVKSYVPIIVPLIVSSILRASELAMAMETRCYNGGINRTRMNELKFGINDLIIISFVAVYFIGAFMLKYFRLF